MLRLERAPNLSFLSFRLELYAERQGFKGLDHIFYSRQERGQPQMQAASMMQHPARQIEIQKTQTLGPRRQVLCR
jgi:hypothetical protein